MFFFPIPMDFPPFSNVSTVFQYFTRQILLFKYFRDNKEWLFQNFKKDFDPTIFWLYVCFVKPRRKNIWLGNDLRTDLSFEKELWGSDSVTDEYGKNISCFIHCLQISISLHINDMVIEDFHKNTNNLEQISHQGFFCGHITNQFVSGFCLFVTFLPPSSS